MKNSKLLSIIILATIFVSCKEIHCPSFPKEVRDNYFPYSNGNLLKFTNKNSDTITIKIDVQWITDSYSFNRYCKCACEAEAGFFTEMDNNFVLKISGLILFYSKESSYILSCEFHNSYLNNDMFEIVKNDFAGVNGVFGDTIFIEKQEYYRIGSVKIVKNKGIVEFWDKEYDCIWVKTE